MGLRIGDAVRDAVAFQARQAGVPARTPRPAPAPQPSPVQEGSPLQQAASAQPRALGLSEPRRLTEPPQTVASSNAAAVAALNRNLREAREAIPSLEERLDTLQTRFEQARSQVFGPSDGTAVQGAAQPERTEPRAEALAPSVGSQAPPAGNDGFVPFAAALADVNGSEQALEASEPAPFQPRTRAASQTALQPGDPAQVDLRV